jgi:hypothetical protein
MGLVRQPPGIQSEDAAFSAGAASQIDDYHALLLEAGGNRELAGIGLNGPGNQVGGCKILAFDR